MEKLKQFFGKVSDYCKKAVQWFMGLPKKAHIIIAVVLTAILVGTGTGLIVSSLNKAPDEPVVSIIDGYVAINGEKTEHKVTASDEITVSNDGYVVVNGVKTTYKVATSDVITVSNDGYVVVNGVKTTYKVATSDVITVSSDGYVVVNGVKTSHKVEHAHSYGDWILYNEGEQDCTKKLYYKKCLGCSVWEWKEGTHTYSESYSFNGSIHWQACKDCGNKKGEADHAIGNDGLCTICGAPLGETEGIVYGVSTDGTYAEVLGYTGTAKNVKIADTYMGLPVKVIYDEAFKSKSITSVIIPDSVTSIGSSAFQFCSKLTSVTIGNNVTSIGHSAFYYCSSLTSVTIPDSVTSISNQAFYGCDSLTSITIPDSTASIGGMAFSGCNSALYTVYEYGRYVRSGDNPYAVLIEITNKNFSTYTIHEDTKIMANYAFNSCSRLTSITIPDSVTSISERAFSDCSSLTSVTIGNSVTSIGNYAFYNCSSLTSITIPDSVTSISERAFSDCSSLTSVVIPDSVTSIGDYAFAYCSSLTDVYYTGTEEEWAKIVIDSYSNDYLLNATIHYNYVPKE